MEVAEAHLSDKMELALSIQKHRELAGEWVEFRVESSRVESKFKSKFKSKFRYMRMRVIELWGIL